MRNRLHVGSLAGDVTAAPVPEWFEPQMVVMEVVLTRDGAGLAAGAAIRRLPETSLHGLVIRAEAAADGRTESGGAV